MELISVVVITYKRPINILSRAIESVLRQTYSKLELIVVNDAPNEIKLRKEISEYLIKLNDSRIKYIVHEENKGANAARNTGLDNALGKYIAYLDDDDEWLPEKLSVQKKEFEKNKKLGLVYSSFYIKNDKKEKVEKNIFLPRQGYLRALIEDNYIGSTSFPLLLTEAVKKVGGFDVNQKSCQEYELWLRIGKQYDIVGIKDMVGIYYFSEDSTFKGNYESYFAGDCAIIEKHKNLFEKYPIEYSNHFLRMFIYMLKNGQIKKALYFKKKAFKVCWYNTNNILLIYFIKKILKRV